MRLIKIIYFLVNQAGWIFFGIVWVNTSNVAEATSERRELKLCNEGEQFAEREIAISTEWRRSKGITMRLNEP